MQRRALEYGQRYGNEGGRNPYATGEGFDPSGQAAQQFERERSMVGGARELDSSRYRRENDIKLAQDQEVAKARAYADNSAKYANEPYNPAHDVEPSYHLQRDEWDKWAERAPMRDTYKKQLFARIDESRQAEAQKLVNL
jgi:hypothetical protein